MIGPPESLQSALADRYLLERELGQGGMATVYLAHDLRHDRPVALKVLRPELAESLGRQRFLREIRLAAGLNHPHILPLYDSGEAGGFLFFVMPVMEGQTLRDRLRTEGRLSVESAVRVASEVADALDYAHRHDVVHRDIKPENILLHEGHAVVADFGIGKAVVAAAGDSATFTQIGVTVGTPAYMSPEQAAGDALDGRSDLFALGCVLYEMLTGDAAFTGPTVQAIISSRFVHTPPEVSTVRAGIPSGVGQTVSRLLSREAEHRLATGAQVVAALTSAPGAAQAAPKAPEEVSIAVLPFTSLSREPDDEFFADGITEEILNALAQIPKLRVAGRGSAFSLKGKNEDLRSVGAKLNVSTILEGTIRRAGNRLRITAQLSKSSDGYQLWSERYDRVAEDVFAVQDEIASTIAGKLRLTIGEAQGPTRPPTRNLAAYELYLKGRALLYQRGRSIPKALACFEEAVNLDPDYAQAWAGIADGYTTSCYSGLMRGAVGMPRSLEAARRALELDPDLSEGHTALACAELLWLRNYDAAEQEFKRAIELNPAYIQAKAWYGLFWLHWVAGRSEKGFELLEGVTRSDPLSSYAHVILTFSATTLGRHETAIRAGQRGVELDPNSYLAAWSLSEALQHAGRYEEAVHWCERGLEMTNRHAWALATLAATRAAMGNREEAARLFAEARERSAREYFQPSMLAILAEAAGRRDQALAYIDQAERERDPLFVMLTRTWRQYDSLRDDPRFQEVVARLHLPGMQPP